MEGGCQAYFHSTLCIPVDKATICSETTDRTKLQDKIGSCQLTAEADEGEKTGREEEISKIFYAQGQETLQDPHSIYPVISHV